MTRVSVRTGPAQEAKGADRRGSGHSNAQSPTMREAAALGLEPQDPARTEPSGPRLWRWVGVLVAVLIVGWIWSQPSGADALSADGRTTLTVFVLAVGAWAFTSIDDTFVALGAGTALVLSGVLSTDDFFTTLGDDVVWLLVAACVIAAAVTSSGLALRAAAWLVSGARTPRQMVHLTTAALVVTAFMVPSTSGRAALALPVFVGLAAVLGGEHARLVKVLALVFPTVILLSAVGSLIGAGAHLVTSMLVETAVGEGFTFTQWLLLGLPLAVVSSHLAAELVLRLFSTAHDRRTRLVVRVADLEDYPGHLTGPLSVPESRAATLLCAVIGLWCTQDLHGIHPAIVALGGALVATSPVHGVVSLKETLPKVPWSLLLFMAATLAMGDALLSSGAASYLADHMLAVTALRSPVPFVLAIITASTAAHLLIQSRSARSSVLVPVVMALAPAAGIPVATAAFISTAAAGFCHTLPASAKPVAIFARVDEVATYGPADLRRLSVWLAPLHIALIALFALFIWPHLGLPLR